MQVPVQEMEERRRRLVQWSRPQRRSQLQEIRQQLLRRPMQPRMRDKQPARVVAVAAADGEGIAEVPVGVAMRSRILPLPKRRPGRQIRTILRSFMTNP